MTAEHCIWKLWLCFSFVQWIRYCVNCTNHATCELIACVRWFVYYRVDRVPPYSANIMESSLILSQLCPPSANEPTWKNHFTIYTTNNSYALAFGCFDPDIRSENPCNSKYVYTSRAKVFKRYFSKQHEAVRQPCRMVRREPESRSLTSIVMTSFFSLAHSASSS